MFSSLFFLLSVRMKLSLDDVPTEIYMNKIDHKNPALGTFSQRYYQNFDYVQNNTYKYAIVYIGGEGDLTGSSVEKGSYSELAKRLHAPIFGLEHRFYGKSMPFDQLTNENLRYLSIEQAHADMAEFIKNKVLGNEKAAKDTRILMVGGSYAGAYSSWFR